MSYRPSYIASFEQESGLNTYYEPFLIPEKAFPNLEDCYCFRGKVKRRPGLTLVGRLRRVFTTKAIANISSATTSINLFTQLAITGEPNAQIEPGTATNPITITIAAPISQTLTDTNGNGTLTIAPAGVITAATLNYNTGILTLTFSGAALASAATITVAYFPGLPVMGIRREDQRGLNNDTTVEFDEKYAYTYDQTAKEFKELPAATPTTWNGADSNLFWTTNYGYTDIPPNLNQLFWVTNSNMGSTPDPIYYYDTADWHDFTPQLDGTPTYLQQAQMIIPYKGRLLFLGTWEGSADFTTTVTPFPQRVRFSWTFSPLNVNAFRSDIVGNGGYIDATTNERIVGAEFVKDVLLIKFERSSWKLVFTGNEVLPFVFQKINTELGAESKFSTIPFDRGIFTVSQRGITTDDSVNVERIDVQIPDFVFNFSNNNEGVNRIYGTRDYTNEIAYWAFPKADIKHGLFPNQVLAYNYRNSTYSVFNDSFTCYGPFKITHEKTWAELNTFPWSSWTSQWSTGIFQGNFPQVATGNQHGYVHYLDYSRATNDFSLYITSIDFTLAIPQFTIPNHNLRNDDVIIIDTIAGGGTINPAALNGHAFLVNVFDENTITVRVYSGGLFKDILDPLLLLCDHGSLYFGAGQIKKINGLNITTKVFAPFYQEGTQCRLGYIDYLIDRTDNGQVTADVYVNEDPGTSVTDSTLNPCLTGSSILNTSPENPALIPQQLAQSKIWHRQFVQTVAQNFQVVLSMTPEQRAQLPISNSLFTLHAMAFYLSPNARMTQ